MLLKLDKEKGLFYLLYNCDPAHTHSSAEIVEMAKLRYTRWLHGNGNSSSKKNTPKFVRFPKARCSLVGIPEDDRFKLELPSDFSWGKLVPKLREIQLHELEPENLDLIHQTYTKLIDDTDTTHVFTTSQFLQFLSIYILSVQFLPCPGSCYIGCPGRFKCKSWMSLQLNEGKGLFYLSYTNTPIHTHSSSEIVEMTKERFAKRFEEKLDIRTFVPKSQLPKLQGFPVDITEDDRFRLQLPSKVKWKEFIPKLREPQLCELEPGAVELVHQTYTKLIDSQNTTHAFTTSQFLQFLSIYLPFITLKHQRPNTAYIYCPKRFECKSTISLKLDEEEGMFFLSYKHDPVHTHSSSDVVEMAKVAFTKRSKLLYVNIIEDDRFRLELPSKVNFAELWPMLKERFLYELDSAASDLVHQTYTNLINLKGTTHVFTMSQFLQFISMYHSFIKFRYNSPNTAYIYCRDRFKCNSTMLLKLNEEKLLFSLSYTRDPTHNHSSEEVVKMAKAEYMECFQENCEQKSNKVTPAWVPLQKSQCFQVVIPEDDRFKLDLPSKVNWMKLVPKLRGPQLHELESGPLESIHLTYTKLIDLKDTVHVFTTSQFLQFLSIYLPFLSLEYRNTNKAYIHCPNRFKCKSTMSLRLDEEKGLFYVTYTRARVHTHDSSEVVKIAKLHYEKRTDFQNEKSTNNDFGFEEGGFGDGYNVGCANGGDSDQVRDSTTSNLITLSQIPTMKSRFKLWIKVNHQAMGMIMFSVTTTFSTMMMSIVITQTPRNVLIYPLVLCRQMQKNVP
ncbi:unnamed protein product [Ambrosiozyma monospora]|uniref:Unnamed protein product n=1 Tax=Ambrosiozyma monospora TaxID=43982 RepID=A0ACB5T627_AMBMO|nr:unnamed protein product [Ambrosiozyma monospora]